MNVKILWALWTAFLLWQPSAARCNNAASRPMQDYWMGVYYKQSKSGLCT